MDDKGKRQELTETYIRESCGLKEEDMPAVISYVEALKIAAQFGREVEALFPGKIAAVFAIGSLGSDYYRPGQSDIDTAVITGFSRKDIAAVTEKIEKIADSYQKRYHVPKGFGAVVFAREQLYPPYVKEEELVQEILRLKCQSRPVFGAFDTRDIPMPDREALRNDILHFQEWADSQPCPVRNAVTMVNSTLIALKRYLLLKYQITEFNKFKVIDLYLTHEPPMVNQEIFDFITRFLNGQPCEWDDEICRRYAGWHDELYWVINEQVLYKT